MDSGKLERLLGVGPALAAGLDLEAVLRRIIDAARDVTGARYVALGVLTADGRSLERFLTTGLTEEESEVIGDLPHGRGVLGELIRNPAPLRLHDVSEHPRSYGFPVGHPPMKNFLGVPIRVRGEPYGNLYLTEKPGVEFDDEDEEIVVRLADWAGIAIDNARLHGAVRDRQSELERTVEVLEINVEVARAIGAATELQPVLELIAKRGRALVQARCVVVGTVQGDSLSIASAAGSLDSDVIGLKFPWDPADTRLDLAPGQSGAVPAAALDALRRLTAAEDLLAVQLVFRNRVLGLIAAADRLTGGPAFAENDRRLLYAFGASASIAVAAAHRATQSALRQSIEASERERARWARELHDETLQDIGAVRLLLTNARASDNGGDSIEAAIERLGEMSNSLRTLIAELRPAVLDQLGLQPALEALVERVARDVDAQVGLHVDLAYESGREPTRLTSDLELALYRVTQEALTNAGRHSGAARIEASVVESVDGIELSIRDDGHGFDPSAYTAGFGLSGIRERVEEKDGTLDVASGPGRGTVIHAELPVRRAG